MIAPVTRPQNAVADMKDHRISIRFDLPLEEPADLRSAPLELRLYDPYYYYAYTVTQVAMKNDPSSDCAATVIPTASISFIPAATTGSIAVLISTLKGTSAMGDGPEHGSSLVGEVEHAGAAIAVTSDTAMSRPITPTPRDEGS